MNNESVFFIAYVGIGLLIAVAFLPWSDKPKYNQEGSTSWLAAWAFFWPYLLLVGIWLGFNTYLNSWRNFYGRKLIAKSKTTKNIDEEIGRAAIKIHQTIKSTYFKRPE